MNGSRFISLIMGFIFVTFSAHAKDNSALLSFSQIQKLSIIDKVKYTESLGKALKSKRHPAFMKAVLSKNSKSTACFHGFFSIESKKCNIQKSKVLRFFSDRSNSTSWELLRYNVQHHCKAAKSCPALKASINSYYKKPRLVSAHP